MATQLILVHLKNCFGGIGFTYRFSEAPKDRKELEQDHPSVYA